MNASIRALLLPGIAVAAAIALSPVCTAQPGQAAPASATPHSAAAVKTSATAGKTTTAGARTSRIVANVTKVANVVPSNLGKVDLWSAQTVGALQYQAGQQWLLTTQLAPVMLAYTGQ